LREAIVGDRIRQGEQLADRLDVYGAREAVETGAVRQILEREEPVDTSPFRDALAELRKTRPGRERIGDESPRLTRDGAQASREE
jgi:DNA-binding GntR family transcriptional regulator